jgi:hypothetical protein
VGNRSRSRGELLAKQDELRAEAEQVTSQVEFLASRPQILMEQPMASDRFDAGTCHSTTYAQSVVLALVIEQGRPRDCCAPHAPVTASVSVIVGVRNRPGVRGMHHPRIARAEPVSVTRG